MYFSATGGGSPEPQVMQGTKEGRCTREQIPVVSKVLPFSFPQFVPLYFPGAGLGQVVNELDGTRVLVGGGRPADMGLYILDQPVGGLVSRLEDRTPSRWFRWIRSGEPTTADSATAGLSK